MEKNKKREKIRVGTLFSGIGAPEVALKELDINHEVIFACEKDIEAKKTYLANHRTKYFFDDITKINEEAIKNMDVDLLIFGAPCQSFSLAGKRKGLKDERGRLFIKAIQITQAINPDYVLIENVTGLQTQNKGKDLEKLIRLMNKAGYSVKKKIINSRDFGVPQNRSRIYIVLIKKTKKNFFSFSEGREPIKKLSDVLDDKVDKKYYATSSFLKKQKVKKKLLEYNKEYINCITNTIARNGSSAEYINYVAAVNAAIHQKRKPTPRECARLHGFPEEFILLDEISTTQLYRQFANTMTVPVIKEIIKKMLVDGKND